MTTEEKVRVGAIVGAALLVSFLLVPAGPVAEAGVLVQMPPDTDGNDTDGDGDANNDHLFFHTAAADGYCTMADGRSLYCFGFADATGYNDSSVMSAFVLGAEIPAPTVVLKEGQKFYLTLTNVGMMQRPDLFDPHTVHFHGFPQAAPIFDGVPNESLSINMGASLTYFYNIVEPGTYIWHCHVEATEHMQMGMLGNLYVLPIQNNSADGTDLNGFTHHTGYKYVYNDGDGSTYYDVEYALQFSSMDPVFHDASRDTQPLPFAIMRDKYFLLNGRGYPDTISPGPIANENGRFAQKVSSLIMAEKGQKVLLRLTNVSVTEYATLTTLGIPMRVVGRGARLLRGPTGEDTSYTTGSVTIGGGDGYDVILDANQVEVGEYYLYSTNLHQLSNNEQDVGGAMTKIVILAPGTADTYLSAISPRDEQVVDITTPQMFSWSYPGTLSMEYTVQIAAEEGDLGSPGGLTFPSAPTTGSYYQLTDAGLTALQTHLGTQGAESFYWRVVGEDTGGPTVLTSGTNHVYAPYSLLTFSPPDEGTQSAYGLPTFTFANSDANLTQFQIQLSPSSDFTARRPRPLTTPTFTGTAYTLTTRHWRTVKRWFARETNPLSWVVYWRVVARRSGRRRRGRYRVVSPVQQFRIDGGTITLTGPDSGDTASLSGAPPAFTWNDSVAPWTHPRGRMGKYILEISKTSGFGRRRTYRAPLRGTSDQTLTMNARTWASLTRRLRIDMSGGSFTVRWRVLGQDQDRVLKTPSQQIRTLILTD